MIAVKVVFSNDEAETEVERGPFNQGVVMEQRDHWMAPAIYDVATRKEIARRIGKLWYDLDEGSPMKSIAYARVFIQAAA
jgi:hypothetical protein